MGERRGEGGLNPPMLSRTTVIEEDRPVGITSTVPGVYNGLVIGRRKDQGQKAEDGEGIGMGRWLFLSQTLLRIRIDPCAMANEKQL